MERKQLFCRLLSSIPFHKGGCGFREKIDIGNCSDLSLFEKNCSDDLKVFANSRSSASKFKSFSRSLKQFSFIVGQNKFRNKIPFLTLKLNFEPLTHTIMYLDSKFLPPAV